MRTLIQLAKDYERDFPLAARCLTDDFYVDDYLSGAPTEAELIQKAEQTRTVLKKGGFVLDKWASNSSALLRNFATGKQQISLGGDSTGVLGLL